MGVAQPAAQAESTLQPPGIPIALAIVGIAVGGKRRTSTEMLQTARQFRLQVHRYDTEQVSRRALFERR